MKTARQRQRGRRLLLLTAVLLIASAVGLLGWWWGRPTPSPGASAWSARPGAAAGDGTASAGSQAVTPDPSVTTTAQLRASFAAVALPPEGTPLATVYNELAARSRDGDTQAAVRLYRDVKACRVQRLVDAATRTTNPALDCLRRQLCAGLRPELSSDPYQWLWSAAEGGDLDARAYLASGLWLHDSGVSGYRELTALQYATRMRQHAVRWLRDGVAAGHVPSLTVLGGVYGMPEGAALFNSEWLPQDPLLALAYRLAGEPPGAEIALDPSDIELYAMLTDDQHRQAEMIAQRLRAAYLSPQADQASDFDRMVAQMTHDDDPAAIAAQAPACVAATP